jgi:hypothetical protein
MADPISGYQAIAGTPPKGKTAYRTLKRMPDGTVQTVLVDSGTGLELPSSTGYSVVDSSNYLDLNSLGLNPLGNPNTTPDPTTADKVKQPERSIEGGHDTSRAVGRETSRTATDNFGYIDKPSLVSLAGYLPGAIGMGAKAVNAGINANNVAATSAARNVLGLPAQSAFGTMKGIVKDNQGQVADVNLGKNTYQVGLEAMSPQGQTNLTPMEARNRALTTQQALSEATPEEAAANHAAFAKETGQKSSFFSNIVDHAKSFIDDLFSSDDNGLKDTSFPDAPKAGKFEGGQYSGSGETYDGKSYSGQNTGLDTPSENSGRGTKQDSGRGLSPGASNAIDHNQGGLY